MDQKLDLQVKKKLIKLTVTKKSSSNQISLEDILKKDKNKLLENIIQNHIEKNKSLEEILEYESSPDNIKLNTDISNIYKKLMINKFRNETQQKYIQDVLEQFRTKSNRVLIKAPTGYGKTVLNYMVINELQPDLVLWLTPRRNLNVQSKDNKYMKYLTKTTYETYNYSVEDSTEDSVDKFLSLIDFITNNKRQKKKGIVFVCYQSCPILIPKLYDNKIQVNLTVCDEAHTIETWGSLHTEHMKLLLDPNTTLPNENVSSSGDKVKFIEKLIFATATPKADMINKFEHIFGKLIEHVNIYELIEQGILCNFETIIKKLDDVLPDENNSSSAREDESINQLNDDTKNKLVITKKNPKKVKKHSIDLCHFVVESMKKYNKHKGVIYFSTQERVREFYKKMKENYKTFKSFIYISDNGDITQHEHFDSKDTSLKSFEDCKQPCIIITCNKMSYGYDNVFIDLICFGDPRESDVDIRQILGRGLRNNIELYPDKLLHILIPIYKFQMLDETVTEKDSKIIANKLTKLQQIELLHDIRSFERLKEFIIFIISECGKDIIEGKIVNKIQDIHKLIKNNLSSSSVVETTDKTEETVKIPPEICRELCTTGYNRYKRFIMYLRFNNVYNEVTYNAFRESNPDNDWMPLLGDIRKRYRKFCFKDINAPENAGYYDMLVECNNAYEKCLIEIAKPYGKIYKLKEKKTIEQINKKIIEMDSRIPINKELYYYHSKD